MEWGSNACSTFTHCGPTGLNELSDKNITNMLKRDFQA